MREPFVATMKLITGEEVLAEVAEVVEDHNPYFVVANPVVINESMHVDHRKGCIISGLTPKKWMMYANDDMTIIYRNHVISISELDKFGIEFYQKALRSAKISSPIKRSIRTSENTGFVGKIETSRKRLEKLFNKS